MSFLEIKEIKILKDFTFSLFVIILLSFPAYSDYSKPQIAGELKKWHKITITFNGPQTNEDHKDNPFLNYRLDVVFTHKSGKYIIPGFYAADGNAAYTSAKYGNKWKVRFTPDKEGKWEYKAFLFQGKDIAIEPFDSKSKPLASGSFSVITSDKSGPDFRAKGMLRYIGKRYLQFSETNEYFLKLGADSPENFLAYYEFDGTYDTDDEGNILKKGFLHKYNPHIIDFKPGNPTWKNGKGKEIIGALNYLSSKKVNSVYFIPYNIDGGDGKDIWPWTNHDQRLRFDCSKLDQWEIVFSHMDSLGLMMHIILQEEENSFGLDKGELGIQRKLYYREMIARFSHHLALVWNLGEENQNTTEQQKDFARYIRNLDPYNHPIVLHTYPDNQEKVYTPLLGFDCIEGASLQTTNTHNQTKIWIEKSGMKGRPWFVCLDENAGVKPDDIDFWHDEPRKEYLWPNLMAGGAGVEWYFGYDFPHNDLNCEDWRSRDHLWDLTRYAINFFQDYLPFWQMSSSDHLTSTKDALCFATPGYTYAIYLPDGGTTELDLENHKKEFTVNWYDPRKGGELLEGSIKTIKGPGRKTLGSAPYTHQKDWAVLVRFLKEN